MTVPESYLVCAWCERSLADYRGLLSIHDGRLYCLNCLQGLSEEADQGEDCSDEDSCDAYW